VGSLFILLLFFFGADFCNTAGDPRNIVSGPPA